MSRKVATSRHERAYLRFRGWWAEFWKSSRKRLWVLLASVAAVYGLEMIPAFHSMDLAFLDVLVRFKSAGTIPKGIFVVEITDQDYKDIFHSTSPLNPKTVIELVKAVAQAHPAVIGVDLDTRDEVWKAVSLKSDELSGAELVWAGWPDDLSALTSKRAPPAMVSCPLGGYPSQIPPANIGLVVVPQDSDGEVRESPVRLPPVYLDCRNRSRSNKDEGKDSKEVADFVSPFDVAIGNICGKTECWGNLCEQGGKCDGIREELQKTASDEAKEPRYVAFTGGGLSLQRIQASEFLDCVCDGKPCPDSAEKLSESCNYSQRELSDRQKDALRNKVVIIGGKYSAARDEYQTPVGKMAGVELLAHGVYAVANDRYILANEWLSSVADLCVGFLVVLGWYSFRHNFLLTAAVGAIGFAFSPLLVLAGANANVWLGAAPVVAMILVHRTYEGHVELTELRQELREKLHSENRHSKMQGRDEVLQVREQVMETAADGTSRVTVREIAGVSEAKVNRKTSGQQDPK